MTLAETLTSPLIQLNGLGLAGIVAWHLIPARRANTRLVVQIAFFLSMTAVLLAHGIEPQRADGVEDGDGLALLTAKLLWWTHLAWALIGFVRIYLVVEGRPHEARLMQDLVVAVVYLGTVLSILAFVFGIPVGTLAATSGVVAIVLGLALQNTLGDMFSGIALTIGRPYVIGDWILLGDGIEGKVVESNWRATHLLTGTGNLAVLPNSVLARLTLTNISRPGQAHLLTMPIRIAPTRMPAAIVEIVRTALSSCNEILRDPPPVVAVKGLDAMALELELQFTVASPAHRTLARNEIVDLVYRHAKSAGIMLALPPDAGVLASALPTEETAAPPVTPARLVNAIPLFASLTPEERLALAEASLIREFAQGEAIVRRGAVSDRLMIVRAGIVAMRAGDGEERTLSPGDYFGEAGLLTGAGESFSYDASTRVIVYEIRKEALAGLMEARPALAEGLALHLSRDMPNGAVGVDPTSDREALVQSLLRSIRAILRR